MTKYHHTKITRAQRVALKRIFDRGPLWYRLDGEGLTMNEAAKSPAAHSPLTYREFRGEVHVGYDCIMIDWCGMWLGIEPDGYTHS